MSENSALVRPKRTTYPSSFGAISNPVEDLRTSSVSWCVTKPGFATKAVVSQANQRAGPEDKDDLRRQITDDTEPVKQLMRFNLLDVAAASPRAMKEGMVRPKVEVTANSRYSSPAILAVFLVEFMSSLLSIVG